MADLDAHGPAKTLRTQGYAFAGSARSFVGTPDGDLLASLEAHHKTLGPGAGPSSQQRTSWSATISILKQALGAAERLLVGTREWAVILEWELPYEGGRRPDAVILAGAAIVILEFKDSTVSSAAHVDQVRAYARDVREYHSASRGHDVLPLLLYRSDVRVIGWPEDVHIATPDSLVDELVGAAGGQQVELRQWLAGSYAPLPTIVQAARKIFRHEPLPRLRQADSLGLPDTVAYVNGVIEQTRSEGGRRLVLIAGVPGAGKTLAGLSVVYEHTAAEAPATFLSGNGPLVEVLQDALKSRVFVRDLHKFILEYGVKERTPPQNVIVFDEAQRAWDRNMMGVKKGVAASEPELLVAAGDRVPEWCVLVGLVGDGQEIHSGEEGGLGQWADALSLSSQSWEVHCAPRLAKVFAGFPVTSVRRLDLNRSMRSHRAEDLHLWVSHLLGEEPEAAAHLASRLTDAHFSLRMTRDLAEAMDYLVARYREEPQALFGLVASSHAKNLASLGIANDYQSTKRVKIARWFNAPADDPHSACALEQPATEFMCQGLELDMPLICWGADLLWQDAGWRATAIRRQIPLIDPDQIVRNTYRVLMTRGRDGLLFFVPPGPRYDATANALQAAGVALVEPIVEPRAA